MYMSLILEFLAHDKCYLSQVAGGVCVCVCVRGGGGGRTTAKHFFDNRAPGILVHNK